MIVLKTVTVTPPGSDWVVTALGVPSTPEGFDEGGGLFRVVADAICEA